MFTWVAPSLPSMASTTSKCVALSRVPNGFAPLHTFCARPSQKLRKLKTASTALGVLRPVTLRVLIRWAASVSLGKEKTGSTTGVVDSTLVATALPPTAFCFLPDWLLLPLLPAPALLEGPCLAFGRCGEPFP